MSKQVFSTDFYGKNLTVEVGELAKQTLECMEDCPLAIGKQLLISKDVPFNCNRYATVLILMRV